MVDILHGLIVPNHLAVILDGNRRWSRKEGKRYAWMGHREGARNVERFLEWCMELNIPQVSLYVLSTENLERPKREVEELFKLYYKYLEKMEKDESGILQKYEVKVRFVGDLSRLPPKLRRLAGKIMAKTAKYQKKALNLLIAYGSQYEITEVAKKIAKKALKTGRVEVTKKDIEKNLLIPVPVDLVIRTGGYSRLSNFLLWQVAYAEMYVTNTLWPDFTKKELIKAIRWFNKQQRNYGQ